MGVAYRCGSAALLAVLAAGGCQSKDADILAQMGRKIAAKVAPLNERAQGKLGQGLEALRAGWDEASAAARVAARLRWDKALAGADIQVSGPPDAVELAGSVADQAQRQRAVQLAEATAGVEQVVDKLTVAEP
jgi:hypothetical protein